MQFSRDDSWNPLPHLQDATGIAADAGGRIHILHRSAAPLTIVQDGKPVSEHLANIFSNPHGLTLGPDGQIWISDNMDHTLRVFSPDHELRMQVGEVGQASDTGYEPWYGAVKRSAGPFNMPTNTALAADGSFYVADGYGNACIHHFAPDGTLIRSWGAPGQGPGEFNLPHGIIVDRLGRVLVADRENSRIQLFDAEGGYIEEWLDVNRPCNFDMDKAGNLYVAELGFHTGLPPGTPYDADAPRPRISVLSPQGERIAQIGGDGTDQPDMFFAPHDICVDSDGAIYLAEIPMSACADWGPKPCHTHHALHRFLLK